MKHSKIKQTNVIQRECHKQFPARIDKPDPTNWRHFQNGIGILNVGSAHARTSCARKRTKKRLKEASARFSPLNCNAVCLRDQDGLATLSPSIASLPIIRSACFTTYFCETCEVDMWQFYSVKFTHILDLRISKGINRNKIQK